MQIISDKIPFQNLKEMAPNFFGDMVKGVADVQRETIALDADLHSDLEALLIGDGSKQFDLWGFNLYPELAGNDFIEFDSLINIRPSEGNRSRMVEDESIQRRIREIIAKRIL